MIKGRREDYRKLQAKQKMMREKLRWDTTMTVCLFQPFAIECELSIKQAPPFRGKTAMIEKTNEESESEVWDNYLLTMRTQSDLASQAGTGTMEGQNEESIIVEEDKQMDSATKITRPNQTFKQPIL